MKKRSNPKREMLLAVEEIWKMLPDLRFFQLIDMLQNGLKHHGIDPFYVKDDQYLKNLKAVVRDRKAERRKSVTQGS
jgi:hypothetical protein